MELRDGKYGIVEITKLAEQLGAVSTDLAKVAHNAGIFSLIGLLNALKDLKSIDYAQVKLEVLELSDAERAAVEAAYQSKLDLGDATLQGKVVAVMASFDKAVALVERAIGLVKEGEAIVLEVKAIFVPVAAI